MTDRLPDATGRKGHHRLWLLLLPLFLLLAACPQHFRWNQKLTITVDTPSGPVVASVVQRMDVTYIPKWMRVVPVEIETELRGEGLAVDLGGGRTLLSKMGEGPVTEKVFKDLGRRPQVYAAIQDQVGEPPRVVRSNSYWRPKFVSLTDISDPSTAFEFYGEDFPKVFGPGYAFREMTLEITDEPVTTGQVEANLGKEFFRRLEEMHEQWRAAVIARETDQVYFPSIARLDFIKGIK